MEKKVSGLKYGKLSKHKEFSESKGLRGMKKENKEYFSQKSIQQHPEYTLGILESLNMKRTGAFQRIAQATDAKLIFKAYNKDSSLH